MKNLLVLLLLPVCFGALGQVDTSYIYSTNKPYGTLDIRIAKSSTRYYFLQENKTFSFRERSPGVRTNTYRDMTSWDSSPYTEGNLREKINSSEVFLMNYRLLFPLGYQPGYTKGYPMIVMMHGAGERGNCWDDDCFWADRSWNPTSNNPPAPTDANHELLNNDVNLSHGGKPHLDARNLAGTKLPNDPTLSPRAFPGFVLFAQNMNGWDTNNTQNLIRLVRLVAKKYNIDENRIYIHGLSNGGIATYNVIKRAPWLFAAALPMSAPTDAAITSSGLTAAVAHIPLWIFQGGQDVEPTPFRTEGYLKKFREAGMEVRYTIYENLGHGTWNAAYAEPDFFSWMRSKSKTQIHVFFGNTNICGSGVQMGLSAGFLAYQWEKDGAIIAGATGNEYVANQPGVYRARFSRKSRNPSGTQWEEWSPPVTVTAATPPKPAIEALTTTHLRGPDNAGPNTIKLKSSRKAEHYYWYKNGTLINIPNNSQDDTVSMYTVTTTYTGYNGAYTLKTGDVGGCLSPPSNPVNLFFNNSAPYLADSNTPTSFRVVSTTASTATVAWQDRSTTETAYEIWRRAPGESFVMAGRTAANAQSFTDTDIFPSTRYEYKIRCVNNQGRSHYAPSDNVNTNLVATTQNDTNAPSAPKNLRMVRNTTSSISLQWTASTDDNGIHHYVVYYGSQSRVTDSSNPSYTLTGLPMNTEYPITVKAVDNGGLFSAASNQITGTTVVTGLWYGHSTGAWTDLDQITNWNKPEYTGWVPNVTLAPRTQEEYFNFEFTGYLSITTGGNYYFYINSDDGSRLYIDGKQVVDFDGLHGRSGANEGFGVRSAAVALTAGPHTLRLIFFEYTGDQSLTMAYQGADTKNIKTYIPDGALTSGSAIAAAEAAPLVNITSPEDEQQFTTPASISIAVEASDEDGNIAKVEFYNGDVKLGEDATAPYTYSWNNVPEGNYSITAKAFDNTGQSATASVTFSVTTGTSACAGTGTIFREIWTGIQYNDVASIPVETSPDGTSYLTIFEDPSNIGYNYGTRVSGYLCVPMTGDYTFWIASNDHSELWLSTDADPGNKRKIAYVTGATNPRQWTKFSSQQSSPIRLVQGQRYYVEALHKQGVGSDHMAVGWMLPDGTLERPIPGNRLSPYEAQTMMAFAAAETESNSIYEEGAGDMEIYPNPADSGTDELRLSSQSSDADGLVVDVEIRRMTGEVVYSDSFNCDSNCDGYSLPVRDKLAPGVYLVNVTSGGKRSSKRLLVK